MPDPLRVIFEVIEDAAIVVTPEGRIIHANTLTTDLFGHETEDLVGADLDILLPLPAQAGHRHHLEAFAARPQADRRMSSRGEISGRRADGSLFPANISIRRIEHDGHVLLMAQIRDASKWHALQAQIGWLSHNDRVTGLPNRDVLVAQIEAFHSDTRARPGWVIALDIDGFGFLNAAYGTAAGDRVLATVAGRLSAFVRERDGVVGRLGNDEFLLHLPDVGDRDLDRIAQQIGSEIARPIEMATSCVELTVTMGAQLVGPGACEIGGRVIDAVAAMVDAKSNHAHHLVRFDEQLRDRQCERLGLMADLGEAITRGELWLAYQPIVDALTGAPRAAEALLRWSHPVLGEVSPAVFIPLAEQTDLIDAIGRWTIEQACRQIAAWEGSHWFDDGFQIAVNVSARQLRNHDVVQALSQGMAARGVRPDRVRIEVTETLAMEDLSTGIEVLNAIAGLGVSIGLDDFGTGFSSLAQLSRLPIDEIKIDRAFICGVGTDPAADTIVNAILAIAQVFGLIVVAEGVENQQQMSALGDLGCALIQGWHFAAAEPPADFVATVDRLLCSARSISAF